MTLNEVAVTNRRSHYLERDDFFCKDEGSKKFIRNSTE